MLPWFSMRSQFFNEVVWLAHLKSWYDILAFFLQFSYFTFKSGVLLSKELLFGNISFASLYSLLCIISALSHS